MVIWQTWGNFLHKIHWLLWDACAAKVFSCLHILKSEMCSRLEIPGCQLGDVTSIPAHAFTWHIQPGSPITVPTYPHTYSPRADCSSLAQQSASSSWQPMISTLNLKPKLKHHLISTPNRGFLITPLLLPSHIHFATGCFLELCAMCVVAGEPSI